MNQMILGFYVPQTFLEHAEYIWTSDDPTDIYQVKSHLFSSYLEYREDEETLTNLHKLDKETQTNIALLMAAIHGEI